MPTVLRHGPYRLFFYASDRDESPHVHVEPDDRIAKFWLNPVRLRRSGGFRPEEIRQVSRPVHRHQARLAEAWNEYFQG
jgi:hypothetical protein